MKIKHLLITHFVLIVHLCFGQAENLYPAMDLNMYKGDIKEYYVNKFQLLYKDFSEKPIARYTSMPSFSNEYSFSIETIDGRNYVMSNCLSENYWYAENRKTVQVNSSMTELDNNLYFKIIELFKLLGEQTEKPIISEGLDGITYHFSTTDKDGQIIIGETWSPKEDTILGRLVRICDNIFALGNRKNISQTEILENICNLLVELKQ